MPDTPERHQTGPPLPAPGPDEPNPWQGRRPPPKQILCNACRADGRPCRSFAMENGRCRVHGGPSKRGADSGTFKTGKYSKYLPTNLRHKYVELLGDEELLSLSDEIATQTALIMAHMEKLEKVTEPPWEALRNGIRLLRTAANQFERNPSLLEIRLVQMESMLLEGSSAATARHEAQTTIRELIQEKTKTSAAEWKRLADLQGVITADRAMAFVESILRAARDVINDESQLKALQRRVLQLLPGRDQAVVIESTATPALEATPEEGTKE